MYAVEDLELRPLSVAQLGVWVIQMLEPRNPIFNIAEYLEILGPVDPRPLRNGIAPGRGRDRLFTPSLRRDGRRAAAVSSA